jgi:hypothetical protein
MMARSLRTPSIGRIQKRKTNLLQIIIFRLATRGRSIQKGHEQTRAVQQSRRDLNRGSAGTVRSCGAFSTHIDFVGTVLSRVPPIVVKRGRRTGKATIGNWGSIAIVYVIDVALPA